MVETPERVRLRYRLAGPGRRCVAWSIDGVVKLGVVLVAGVFAAVLAALPFGEGLGMGVLLVALFLLEWLYGAVWETLTGGFTPGKWAMQIRVVRTDGAPAAFPDFLLRNLLRGVDWMPGLYVTAVIAALLDDKLRRVGDFVAGTVVVVEESDTLLGAVEIDPPVSEDERQALPPKVSLSADELRAIETFLRRQKQLSAERAEELAALLGPMLSEREKVEADTWTRVLELSYARATGKDR